jgi:hypothetical protein
MVSIRARTLSAVRRASQDQLLVARSQFNEAQRPPAEELVQALVVQHLEHRFGVVHGKRRDVRRTLTILGDDNIVNRLTES